MAHTHAHSGLDVKVERTGPCLATVRFTVTAEEYQKARRQGLKNYAGRTRMKGFRPGKVPAAVVEKQFGAVVDKELVEHFVQHAYQHAIEDEGLRPAATPRIDFDSIESRTDADWSHEFEVLLRPDVELGQIEGLAVEGHPVDVDEQELDQTLENIRREMSTPEPAGDEGLPVEGMAVCTLRFETEGAEEPVLERDGIRLNPRTPAIGIDPELFEQEMTGAKEGESRSFEITFPEDFPTEDVRGQQGTLVIVVTECFKIVPPSDERVFSEFGVEDEAGLRAEVEQRLTVAKRDQENQRQEQVLLEKLIEAHPLEVPEPIVADQAESKVAELRPQLESQGLDEADIEAPQAEERESAYRNAGRAMRAIYLMEEIAKQHDLKVTAEDFEAEFVAIAGRNDVDPAEVRKYYQEEQLLQQLALELLERKVRTFLRESADIQLASAAD